MTFGFMPYGRLKRTVMLGVKSLWLHRLRSLLTVLGIVCGVLALVAMMAIGEGASYEAQEQIRRLGSNNIILKSVKPPEDRASTQDRSFINRYGLTYKDIDRVRSTVPGVERVVPARIMREDVFRFGRQVYCDIVGTLPEFPVTTNNRVWRGRFFTQPEIEDSLNVCVLGFSMARELFPIEDPLHKTVRVGESFYRVIGIMDQMAVVYGAGLGDENGKDADSQNSIAEEDAAAEHRMYIPLTAAKDRFGEILVERSSGSFQAEQVELHEATVRIADLADVTGAAKIIQRILEHGHKKVDYQVVVPLELLRQAEATKRMFTIVLSAIAAISLVVGGIGIMNIMLASVTERTREIGIRRALGAKQRDIIAQFLIETVLLSGTGGLLGVAFGMVIPFLVTHFFDMKTIIVWWAPVLAFSSSAFVGLFFGIYPAVRASKMDPVEALRHE
jgi:putative ABC transport system permease protein